MEQVWGCLNLWSGGNRTSCYVDFFFEFYKFIVKKKIYIKRTTCSNFSEGLKI